MSKEDIIIVTDYNTMTTEEIINSLYDEINFAVKNRINPKFIERDKILDGWNKRLSILKDRLTDK